MAEKLIFDHYEVLTREDGSPFELGRGAMGITYKAFDTNLRVNVALKVINSKYLESEIAQQRFLREARAAAQLRHPNVASVFHLGTSRDAFFYAMEFVDGETVESLHQAPGTDRSRGCACASPCRSRVRSRRRRSIISSIATSSRRT